MFVPEAYITATRQFVAQANNWSLEELTLEVTSFFLSFRLFCCFFCFVFIFVFIRLFLVSLIEKKKLY